MVLERHPCSAATTSDRTLLVQSTSITLASSLTSYCSTTVIQSTEVLTLHSAVCSVSKERCEARSTHTQTLHYSVTVLQWISGSPPPYYRETDSVDNLLHVFSSSVQLLSSHIFRTTDSCASDVTTLTWYSRYAGSLLYFWQSIISVETLRLSEAPNLTPGCRGPKFWVDSVLKIFSCKVFQD